MLKDTARRCAVCEELRAELFRGYGKTDSVLCHSDRAVADKPVKSESGDVKHIGRIQNYGAVFVDGFVTASVVLIKKMPVFISVHGHLSVIEIDDDSLALEDVIEIFERLNLGGKKLNLFSIIAARSYVPSSEDNPGFDLAKKYEAFNKTLDDKNYGKISDSTFLLAIAACAIEKVNKSEILRSLSNELIITNYAEIEKAIFAAVEHLKGQNYGVLVSNLLPYERLIVPFTYFHYVIGNKHISPQQERYLVDFFWRCIIGKRYNSSADTNMNTDIGKIKAILEGTVPNQEPVILSPKAIFDNGRFSLSSAYVIGMLCLMASAAPQSFAVGRTINITNDAVSNAAKKQYHHFFPLKSTIVTGNAVPVYGSWRLHFSGVISIL